MVSFLRAHIARTWVGRRTASHHKEEQHSRILTFVLLTILKEMVIGDALDYTRKGHHVLQCYNHMLQSMKTDFKAVKDPKEDI